MLLSNALIINLNLGNIVIIRRIRKTLKTRKTAK